MLRETPSLTQNPDLCPGPQGLLAGSPSRFALQQCCMRRLSSRAGTDSVQRSQPSQVSLAWRGRDGLWGQECRQIFQLLRQTALPSACWGDLLCQACLPLPVPFTTAVFSSASVGCQPGTEQMAEPAGSWEHGKSHGQAGAGKPLFTKQRAQWRIFVVTEARSGSAGHLQQA